VTFPCRTDRNHYSQPVPNPVTGPPKPVFSAQNGEKEEKLREEQVLPNSETGLRALEGPPPARLNLTLLTKRSKAGETAGINNINDRMWKVLRGSEGPWAHI